MAEGGKDIVGWFCLIFRVVFGVMLLLTSISIFMWLIRNKFQNVDWLWLVINIIILVTGIVCVALEHLGACIVFIILYIVVVACNGQTFMGLFDYDYALNIIIPLCYGACLIISGKKEMGVPGGFGGK